MKRLALIGLVLSGSLLTASAALADVAPDPCDGKQEGDPCITPTEEPGTCQAVDDCNPEIDCGSGLLCAATGETGSGGGGGQSSGDGGGSQEVGDPEPTDTGSKTESDGCSVKAAGAERDASAFAVLAAVGLGVWLSRRKS